MAITLQTTSYNIIYVLSRDSMPGLLKVGKTSVEAYDVAALAPCCETMAEAVRQRYKEAGTLAVTDLHLLYTEVAHFVDADGKANMFDDHEVHRVLTDSGFAKKEIPNEWGSPDEWFGIDLEHVKKAIAAVKKRQLVIDGPAAQHVPNCEIVFRKEQQAAIGQTLTHFALAGERKMLWNAKMRFGKTLCALELVNRMDLRQVLILTHRPTVRSGWFDDFRLIRFKSPFQYGAKGDKNLDVLQAALKLYGTHYIYFASMQDLRGHEHDTKEWKKNNRLVYSTHWDLIILDEAHEGTQTPLGKQVIADLQQKRKPRMLYLSGTPYNILPQFRTDEIFTWDYVMEQQAKAEWPNEHPHERNPYEGLAQLHIFTYSLSEVFHNNPDYTKSDDEYFNFTEFFRTAKDQNGRFVHEIDVLAFLDLLCSDSPVSYYPFSTDHFRQALSHTLWMLPGVAAADQLAELLQQHKLCTEYGFHVVSVAGEGKAMEEAGDDAAKVERKERDALSRVQKFIKEHPRTITLSCGRLTTGVSVPEWTGVLMLCGGYTTKAATYMQTIFRCQTPYKNGAIKRNCYAFDFAPDRTLTVVDDYLHQQQRSRPSTASGGNEHTASTLRFMPVVAMTGGREKEYDALTFISEVNRAYSDHVISQGFRSQKLFQNFDTFTPDDHKLLSLIGNVMGGATDIKKRRDGTIDVAKNGLTGEGSTATSNSKTRNNAPAHKPKANEQQRLIDHSRRVLYLISTRLPLMLFGAAIDSVGLTIDDLLSDRFIDDESWREFMPHGFTKALFRQVAHLVRIDVLVASAMQITRQTREADALPIEERTRRMAQIVASFHFPDKETVLTPWRVVNMHMTDTLGGYDFFDARHAAELPTPRFVSQGTVTEQTLRAADTRLLEVNSKSGVYPLWLAYTLWRLRRTDGMTPAAEWQLWQHILSRNLYVVCKTRMAEKITRRMLLGFHQAEANTATFDGLALLLKDEHKREALIRKIKSPKTYNPNTTENQMLTFSAVVGNPPYQVMDGGAGVSATPVYNKFVEIAKLLQPSYISMIMPAKWYTDGKGLDDFRAAMLNDHHLSRLYDFTDSRDCFQNVDIAGGVCYFLWSETHNAPCLFTSVHHGERKTAERDLAASDNFVRHVEAESIIHKVTAQSQHCFDERVSTRKPFGLATNVMPLNEGDITLRYNGGTGFYQSSLIEKGQKMIDKWKVIISYLTAEHAGQTDAQGRKRILSSLNMLRPGEICTETYLVVDALSSEAEARHLHAYLRTRFVRFLVAQLAATQHLSKDKFKFVPLQDFTPASDIDWS